VLSLIYDMIVYLIVNVVLHPLVYNVMFISVTPSTSLTYEKVKAEVYWMKFLASKYMVGIN